MCGERGKRGSCKQYNAVDSLDTGAGFVECIKFGFSLNVARMLSYHRLID